jgi:hypothetical protein
MVPCRRDSAREPPRNRFGQNAITAMAQCVNRNARCRADAATKSPFRSATRSIWHCIDNRADQRVQFITVAGFIRRGSKYVLREFQDANLVGHQSKNFASHQVANRDCSQANIADARFELRERRKGSRGSTDTASKSESAASIAAGRHR